MKGMERQEVQLLKAAVLFFFFSFLEQSVIEKNNACQRHKKSGESHSPVPVTTSPSFQSGLEDSPLPQTRLPPGVSASYCPLQQ